MRPCGKGGKSDTKHGGSGVVIVLPLALIGAAATGRRRFAAGARRAAHGLARRRAT